VRVARSDDSILANDTHQCAQRRHGLRRCRYHGVDGMHRWVGFGVIADNLMNIATFTKARATA
jgi:hypothetical protein